MILAQRKFGRQSMDGAYDDDNGLLMVNRDSQFDFPGARIGTYRNRFLCGI